MARNIQDAPRFTPTPAFVLCTGHDAETLKQLPAYGPSLFAAFLQKPVGMPVLRQVLTAVLERQGARAAALAFASDKERALAAGMDDFLTKPFAIRQLYATLRQHLARGVTQRQRFGRTPDDWIAAHTEVPGLRIDEGLAHAEGISPCTGAGCRNSYGRSAAWQQRSIGPF
ncbi:MAG: hypothetical protein ACP59X_01145 [Solidesulfovibrio sp. DCME]|uniref:hypothetical protein n=1 Tax=Solidesulfovibrio sp. DCME TaxID=3447380 RepID=UPI003D09C00C